MPLPPAAIANIGPGEQRQRRLLGIALLGLSVLGLAVFLLLGSARGWRLLLFLPLWGGLLGVTQARKRT